MSSTVVIMVWASILLILLYMIFVVRYYYRIPEESVPLTIIQCTADTYTPNLLREKMPVVCRGIGELATFKALAVRISTKHSNTVLESNIGKQLYSSLRVPGQFCKHAPVVLRTNNSKENEQPNQSYSDYLLDVQLHGTRRVSLWIPTHRCNTTPLRQVDILLSSGDGLFIPFQWWYADSSVEIDAVNTKSQSCTLRWNNIYAQTLSKHIWFGACRQWHEKKKIYKNVL